MSTLVAGVALVFGASAVLANEIAVLRTTDSNSLTVSPTFGPEDSPGSRLLTLEPERFGSPFRQPAGARTAVRASSRLAGDTREAPEYFLRNADNPDEVYAIGNFQKYAYLTGSPLGWSTLVSWQYNPAGQASSYAQADVLAALQRSTARWEAVCNVRFSYAGTTSSAPSMGSCDGQNIVGWTALGGSTVGQTQACYSGSGLTEFDMVLDDEQPYQLSSLGLLEAVATHEFGHALGLGHTSISPAVMTASVSTGSLVQDDIDGCVSLYGAPSTSTAPVSSLSRTSISFTTQTVGTSSAVQTVRITNSGGSTLTLASLTLGGANASDFGRAGTCSAGSSLGAGQSCDVIITFTPLAAGARSASLAIATNANASPQTVALSGTAADPTPVAGLSVTSLAFSSQNVGSTSAARGVRVTNSGSGTLSISGVSVGGAHPGDFGRGGCGAGTSLVAGASCDVSVTFTPTVAGPRSATLAIATNAAGSPALVALSGAGVSATAIASLSATALAFADQVVGTGSSAQNVTLSNSGNAVLSINSIAFAGANASEFPTTHSCPGSLAPGTSCQLQVRFSPVGAGARSASISIVTNAIGSPHYVALAGNGIAAVGLAPQAALTPTALVFASTTVGSTSATQSVTLVNSGTAALTLSSMVAQGANPGDFTVSGTCTAGMSLSPGAACTTAVGFQPTASGSRTASIAYATNAGTVGVSLSGSGIAAVAPAPPAGVPKYSTSSITFRDQAVGTTSRRRSVSLTNNGAGPLLLQQVSLAGTHSTDFALTGTCFPGLTLAYGDSCTMSLTFTPIATGLRTANLAVLTSASLSADGIVVAGNGTAGNSNGRTKAAVTDVVEYYHAGLDHYFLTSIESEMAVLDSGSVAGWKRTGQIFPAGASVDGTVPTGLAINSAIQSVMIQEPALTPVCRFYGNPVRGLDSHFYSAFPSECAEIQSRFGDAWLLESPALMYVYAPDIFTGICPTGSTALYRLYNQRSDANHRYTTDPAVRSEMTGRGWRPEGYGSLGVAMCLPFG